MYLLLISCVRRSEQHSILIIGISEVILMLVFGHNKFLSKKYVREKSRTTGYDFLMLTARYVNAVEIRL